MKTTATQRYMKEKTRGCVNYPKKKAWSYYMVKTWERCYNLIESPQHFKQVRKTWNDKSAVKEAWLWSKGDGWNKQDNKKFRPR